MITRSAFGIYVNKCKIFLSPKGRFVTHILSVSTEEESFGLLDLLSRGWTDGLLDRFISCVKHTPSIYTLHSMPRKRSDADTKTPQRTKKRQKFIKGEVLTEKRCSNKDCPLPQPRPVSEFGVNNQQSTGLQPRCKTCIKQDSKHVGKRYHNTDNGFWKGLLNNAQRHNEERNARGRDLEFSLTLKQLKEKWQRQNGKCFLTGKQMVLRPHHDFKCSVERISNSVGYTDDNTVLIIAELNTATQWTAEKIQYLFSDTVHEHMELTEQVKLTRGLRAKNKNSKKEQGRSTWRIDNEGNVHCHYCNNLKPRAEFNKYLKDGCKKCVKHRDEDRMYGSWYGALQGLYKSCRGSAKRRKMQRTTLLTFKELTDILIAQGGLCYYSGVPMTHARGDFRCSPERLNVNESYSKSNVVLICAEFNSSDYSRIKTDDSNDGGGGGWSLEKYNIIKEAVQSRQTQQV